MNQKQILFSTLALVVLFGALYGVYKLMGTGPDEALLSKLKTYVEQYPKRSKGFFDAI